MADKQEHANGNGNGNGNERGKNKHKGHKGKNANNSRQHHPWDEVSLPGATNITGEQPTILEQINQLPAGSSYKKPEVIITATNVSSDLEAQKRSVENIAELDLDAVATSAQKEPIEFQTSENLVNSFSNDPYIEVPDTPIKRETFADFNGSSSATPIDLAADVSVDDESHVLNLESHLIETYDEYQTLEDGGSVGIRELLPIKSELLQGTSKIDTEDNVHTIIEVEPAGVVTKKPIDTLLLHPNPLRQVPAEAKVSNTHIQHDIRDTAKELVDHIQREVLEKLQKVQDNCENKPQNFNNEKTEELLEEIHENLDEVDFAKIKQIEDSNEILTKKVDTQLSDIPSILKPTPKSNNIVIAQDSTDTVYREFDENIVPKQALKVIDGPTPQCPQDEQDRKLFIESLPQLGTEPNTQTDSEAYKLSSACKREYYQSLKKYLIQSNTDKPPIPLQTYRWEDLRRAKERGGYPWTHLYKRPLGPEEEPEIVLLLRKSQELRFQSESPKSLKKVRIDEQVLVKETERYIQELSETEPETDTDVDSDAQHQATNSASEEEENHSLHSESISCVSDSVLATRKPRKTNRLASIRALFRRRRFGHHHEDTESIPGESNSNSANPSRVHSEEAIHLAPAQIELPSKTVEKKPRSNTIMKKLRSMADRQKKRLNIKRITLKKEEKIILADDTKILHLKHSPKSDRSEIPHFIEKQDSDDVLEIVQLDESPSRKYRDHEDVIEHIDTEVASTSHVQPDEVIEITHKETEAEEPEETEQAEKSPPRKTPRLRREHVYEEIEQLEDTEAASPLVLESVAALKESLAKQDSSLTRDIEVNKSIPLDRMGSSEEEQIASTSNSHLLAPISSIDSTSSEEAERIKAAQLSPVAEEADDAHLTEQEMASILRVVNEQEQNELQLKPSIKKEPSPAPSDKKVTFSHVEDEAEPHREDIELPDEILEAAATAKKAKTNDHEYEPIGVSAAEGTLAANQQESPLPMDIEKDNIQQAEDLQRDFEERYFSSEATTPRTESRTDYEIHTSQVDSSALEELPLKPENRKKGFMASAQDRTRRMQAGFKTQAGKIKTKLRTPAKKASSPSGSPKVDKRKRFKAPEFSKIKMPEIKRPDMSKFKEFKRPEFTKFNKPDMSKFKLPEKFSTLKLRRSKSFKENEPSFDDEMESGVSPDSTTAAETQQHKKMFDFNFGTYPRAFRKKKKPLEPELSLGTEEPSIIPSTETQPSMESSSSPKGDRGPGPVRSRWADKFSDVSYNDSEGSRYRRYESELGSFDRESSLEQRMKDDLEDTGSEVAPDLGILSGADDTRQFAEFDEENRAIHEISSQRAGEFKRRPMIHQDSDLRSEDSKDVGWTEKEVQKNKLLRKAELEAEATYLKYPSEESQRHETQSTASSGKKVVMEEIDDDQFFLRKRGISEDNIEFRQYISNAIRQGYDIPINALQHVGHTGEPMEFEDFEVPPPKPRRLHKSYRPEEISQEFHSRSEFDDDLSISQNGSDFYPPKRPLRKGRSRSKYSVDSQDIPMTDEQLMSREQYFDDDEEYLRPPRDQQLNNLDKTTNAKMHEYPQPPRRRKRHENSMEKDSYVNGLTGRSVSSSYLQPNEDVIVYRTEHQYPVPLATPENYTDGSRSVSRFDDSEHILHANEDDGSEVHEKFIIDMMENDGYATVRKEQLPKPTPPARRKKFSRTPGERFATLPNMRTKRSSTSPPERPPPPRDYLPSVDPERPQPPLRKSALSLDATQNYEEDDYEEPAAMMRSESPKNLHSGDVINKMKYRPLPPPPRPPREKRLRGASRGSSQQLDEDDNFDDRDGGGERIASSSVADSYEQNEIFEEVEASTQTDPLPDDFVCEEFEITPDMKIIEPRQKTKTLDEMLKEEQKKQALENSEQQLTEDEQLARGLQRFRDANQRSLSERSRVSSQADRSHSQSRPQTPSSAVIIERRVSTPVPSGQQEEAETALAASLIVRPIDDLDLEEEALRREGLLTDSSQHSKSDIESQQGEAEAEESVKLALSDYSASVDLDAALENLRNETETDNEMPAQSEREEILTDSEIERKLRDSDFYEKDSESEKLSAPYDEEDITAVDEVDVQAELERIRREEQEDVENLQNEIARLLRTTKEQEEFIKQTEEEEEKRKWAEYEKNYKEYETREEEEEEVEREVEKSEVNIESEEITKEEEKEIESPPQPPPRRKSAANIDVPVELTTTTQTAEQSPIIQTPIREELSATTQTPVTMEPITEQVHIVQNQFPTHVSDLEVQRLRVHALQAGQIMVGQLHGAQVSADELECKSGNLVVSNFALPPGLIEDIVDRVRSTERSQLQSSETQTSEHASRELLPTSDTEAESSVQRGLVPPPKPPRQRDLSAVSTTAAETATHINLDEETQTEPTTAPAMVPVFPTIEYLQSLAPLAFYNLERQTGLSEEGHEARRAHHHHHHHHRRRESSGSDIEVQDGEATVEPDSTIRRRQRTRSPNSTSATQTTALDDAQSLAQASRQFVSACSMSLVNTINQLTSSLDSGKTDAIEGATSSRQQQTLQMITLFVILAVALLIYMMSGRNVHTHHWDYFNPPGNEGRPS